MSNALWKKNWKDAKRHFTQWWNHTGTVVTMTPGNKGEDFSPWDNVLAPAAPGSLEERYTNGRYRALHDRAWLANINLWADNLPMTWCHLGPGSLAIYLGSEPKFMEDTVWYNPCITDPDKFGAIKFDPAIKWWQVHVNLIRDYLAVAKGNYFVGAPDLIENLDILASLRGSEELMMDILLRPEWVKQKVDEIEKAFFEVYDRVYEMIKLPDKSSFWGAFDLWGPGKTVKVQCDLSAMLSPDAFNTFAAPSLRRQCGALDNTMYHLDGTQAMGHLDSLLAIKELDAIEWTPQAGIEGPGHPRWVPLYKKILDHGKSLQVMGASKADMAQLVDAIGIKGVYFSINDVETEKDYEAIMKTLERCGYAY